jgi:hypothetical protein
MAVFEFVNNRFDAALGHAAEWELVARTLPDAERRACALWPTLQTLFARGDLAALRANCVQQFTWTEEHPEWGMRDWGLSALVNVLNLLSTVELLTGSFDRARELVEQSLEIARRVGDLEGEVWAIGPLSDLGFFAGDPDFARTAVERCVRMSDPLGALARSLAYSRLGQQLVLDRRATEAIEALQHALSCCNEANLGMSIGPSLRYSLARAWLAAGDAARARPIAEDALTECLNVGARLDDIQAALAVSAALRVESRVASAPRIDQVLATADRLIAETGAHNMTAFVLVERAALAALAGNARQREEHLLRARDAFTRMGATGRARQIAAMLETPT